VLRTGVKGAFNPGRKKAEVFGHFGHRLMPHSVVVWGWIRQNEVAAAARSRHAAAVAAAAAA